jgi:hypothetical protein
METKKFIDVRVGEKFTCKDGEFKKAGRTTALCIVSTNFPQHEGKVVGGFAKNHNVQTVEG